MTRASIIACLESCGGKVTAAEIAYQLKCPIFEVLDGLSELHEKGEITIWAAVN